MCFMWRKLWFAFMFYSCNFVAQLRIKIIARITKIIMETILPLLCRTRILVIWYCDYRRLSWNQKERKKRKMRMKEVKLKVRVLCDGSALRWLIFLIWSNISGTVICWWICDWRQHRFTVAIFSINMTSRYSLYSHVVRTKKGKTITDTDQHTLKCW